MKLNAVSFCALFCLILFMNVQSNAQEKGSAKVQKSSDVRVTALGAQKDFNKPQVKVVLRFVTMDESVREAMYKTIKPETIKTKTSSLGKTEWKNSDATLESSDAILQNSLVSTCLLDASKTKKILKMVAESSTSKVFAAPGVNLFDGQVAEIKDGSERPFVTDIRRVQGKNGTSVQPKVESLEEGVSVNLSMNFTKPKAIKLSSRIRFSQIMGVKTERIYGFSNENTFVQIPVHHRKTLNIAEEVELGQTLMIDPYYVRITTVKDKTQIPIIGKLPVVKKIGTKTTFEKIRQRMIILLIPRSSIDSKNSLTRKR